MSPEKRTAYQPQVPARRPGGKPEEAPTYRVLIHRKYLNLWLTLPEAIGMQQAQQFWDHVAMTPGTTTALAGTRVIKGRAGNPIGPGWSKTIHYDLSSKGRANYQFHNEYVGPEGDAHHVVFIQTLDLSSH